jgi:fructose-bisphosphate aldolase class II
MSLASLKPILAEAKRGKYLVAAWDTWGQDSIQAVLEAAEELASPAILAVAPHLLGDFGFDLACYTAIAKQLTDCSRVPVALHLDECPDFQQVMQCIRLGFSSVMYDGSRLAIQDNISECQTIVKVAHSLGVSVEGMVGIIPDAHEGLMRNGGAAVGLKTSPEDAIRFVEETGVDALAISVGNVHMLFREQVESLDLGLAQQIGSATGIPLVLHGGTGVPDRLIPQVIEAGFCKVNIGTALYGAYDEGLASATGKNPGAFSTLYALESAKDSLGALIRRKMHVYGSVGRA